MNQVDALLLVLLVPFALRGWIRGFCRESVGLAGLIAGGLAAAAFGPELAAEVLRRKLLPPVAAEAAAFAAIFIGVNVVAHVFGRLADRLARALFLGGVNRIAGVAFGVAKGAALLGFVLLVTEELAPVPSLAKTIAASRLGRPLTAFATDIVAAGKNLAGAPPRPAEHRA